MNLKEITTLLGTASMIDPRVTRKTSEEVLGMAQAWLKILDDRITLEFALQTLQEHYATSTETFMPAHLMKPWKAFRKEQLERESVAQLTGTLETGGMPDSVRAKLLEIGVLRNN